jgi:hypothetical protein
MSDLPVVVLKDDGERGRGGLTMVLKGKVNALPE